MDHRFWLVVPAFLIASTAQAGYAQLSPPTGFVSGPGGFTYAHAANDLTFGRTIFQPGALRVPVPGSLVTMPAAYRLAANAPRIVAAAIFLNPALRTAVGIASWLGVAQIVWDAVNQKWTTNEPGTTESTGKEYRADTSGPYWPTKADACNEYGRVNSVGGYHWTNVATENDYAANLCKFQRRFGTETAYDSLSSGINNRNSACPAGWYITQGGVCTQTPQMQPLTQAEMVDLLNPAGQPGWPMPSTVPGEFPNPIQLPVEQPVINPAPGENPSPNPRFVPTGDPVRNPNYDPNAAPGPANQPWVQPGVQITPRGTPTEPWRVDVKPVDRPQPGPDPITDPDPSTDPNDTPKPEDQKSLCEQHPDILACAKTGDLTAQPVPNQNKSLAITPDTGYGPSNSTCPAPRTATIMGVQLSMPFDLICQFATEIRPIVIGFAWLAAALTFFGFSRKDS